MHDQQVITDDCYCFPTFKVLTLNSFSPSFSMATVNMSQTKNLRLYNPTGVSGAFISTHGLTFSCNERQAASHTMLHHNQHTKDYSLTRTTGGLHPMYISLHGIKGSSQEEKKEVNALLEDTLHDLFDVVHMQFN